MPPIREDANAIFTDVSHRRSRSSSSAAAAAGGGGTGTGGFYQYGEDYITAYDRVGIPVSPSTRPASRAGSIRSASSSTAPPTYYSGSGRRGTGSTRRSTVGSAGSPDEGTGHEGEGDLERGSEGGSEVEKGLGAGVVAGRSWWRRRRRTFVVLLVVIVVTGMGVGLAFGLR